MGHGTFADSDGRCGTFGHGKVTKGGQMTDEEIKKFPLKILCGEIADVLSVEKILAQIERFKEERVDAIPASCELCLIFKLPTRTCAGCPYMRFADEVVGCMQFSKIRYDGFSAEAPDGIYQDHYFNGASRHAALKRYKMALEIKQGKLK